MTNPYRAMCAELLNDLEHSLSQHCLQGEIDNDPLIVRARALLAQPEPEGDRPPAVTISAFLHPAYEPGDGSEDGAQLVGLAWWHPVMGCDSLQMVVDNARAVLARFDRPTPHPPAAGEVVELVARLRESADCCEISSWMKRDYKALARAADLLERLVSDNAGLEAAAESAYFDSISLLDSQDD